MSKALTVYKASAGSGKTFTLATAYIKLLVMNPTSYRHILAVTFTNKATEEMKMRILSQLYGIWKGLSDSDSYLQEILKDTDLLEETVRQRAGEALHLLLHNYNYFRVETIDTFFQSVLRNLARELDLTANLRIGLNDSQVEEEAVDQIIESLNHGDAMLQWLLKYIMESISDDRSWNIIGQVKQFGKTIFRDYYKEHSKALHEKTTNSHFFEAYSKQLRDIRQQALERMKQVGDEFMDILATECLTIEDLQYGKSGVAGFFVKLQAGVLDESIVGKRVADAATDATKWCKKSHERAFEIQTLADSQLMPLLRRAIDLRQQQWKLFKSADLTLRHLNQVRLLSSIEQKVRELNVNANRFLLSDTQQLLHALIKDADSPFIFEKIGTQLEHIMIDEFQDTSTVQWQNFKVLLQECMSHTNTGNLIVGDVKQSIYRWRSGDWRLLNDIEQEIPHSAKLLDIRTLDTNYRSERRIIDFNNAFFKEAARQEYEKQQEEFPQGAEQLKNAYSDVEQGVPEKRGSNGMVSITLLPKEDYQQRTLATLADTVNMQTEQGIEPQHIAILVRTNNIIPLIADYFSEHCPNIHIVSDEAFQLSASIAVNLIIQALHLLTHPDDMLAKATIVKLYQCTVLKHQTTENELLIKGQSLDELLPKEFVHHTDELLHLSLYELAERLYTIFQLDKLQEQSAYVSTFYDQLSRFTQENSTDIDAFIEEWNNTISTKTIQSAETDGIRMLSIHKSKGLEFDNVIIPFCDWRLEHQDILWCHPKEAPFNAMPIAPIDFSEKQMRGTIYEHDYLEEHLQNTVDNLNLLYVAFTRASKNLFVIGRREAKNTRSALIEKVLPLLKLKDSELDGMENNEAPVTFCYGNLYCAEPDKGTEKATSENVFLQPVTPITANVMTYETKTEFRQSNKSREFIEGDDEQQTTSYIKLGSVLHNIFSTIRTTADIEQALNRLQLSGILYDDEVTREKVTEMLRKRLEDDRVKGWFTDSWKLFNECTILQIKEDGSIEERRPDRVMTDGNETIVIDFKFGHPRPEYQQQVSEYMQLLRQMGMPNVKGWLWYVYANKIEEVKELSS